MTLTEDKTLYYFRFAVDYLMVIRSNRMPESWQTHAVSNIFEEHNVYSTMYGYKSSARIG